MGPGLRALETLVGGNKIIFSNYKKNVMVFVFLIESYCFDWKKNKKKLYKNIFYKMSLLKKKLMQGFRKTLD